MLSIACLMLKSVSCSTYGFWENRVINLENCDHELIFTRFRLDECSGRIAAEDQEVAWFHSASVLN
jgi:hypothetical protein